MSLLVADPKLCDDASTALTVIQMIFVVASVMVTLSGYKLRVRTREQFNIKGAFFPSFLITFPFSLLVSTWLKETVDYTRSSRLICLLIFGSSSERIERVKSILL